MTDTNACWLVGPSGKALERIEPAAFNENPHINGLLISTPTEGGKPSLPNAHMLAAARDVMKELDGTGLLEHIRVIDVKVNRHEHLVMMNADEIKPRRDR